MSRRKPSATRCARCRSPTSSSTSEACWSGTSGGTSTRWIIVITAASKLRPRARARDASSPWSRADSAPAMFIGRNAECARLDRLLADTKAGISAVLVLRGATGIGTSALLDYAAERANGATVVRAVGIESEMELPFAGLHQLCGPLLDGLERLPRPQRDALETAFGLSSGEQPDRFLISLATLSLMSEAADQSPLLCLVADAPS